MGMDLRGIVLQQNGKPRYEVVSPIGHGAMGQVWRAVDRNPGMAEKVVAVKTMLREGDEILFDRFRKESDTQIKLSGHDNVVQILDVDEHDPDGLAIPYIVMELVEGESLGERLRAVGKLPVADVRAIAPQILSALDRAHELDVVHRDLKPDNILIKANGRVQVADFGLARDMAVSPGGSRTDFAGTPAYMPPEQSRGKPSSRSDIYAAASTLYELLTGELPIDFTGANAVEQVLRIESVEPRPIAVVAPGLDIPHAVELVLRDALAKRPEDRHATAREFSEALDLAFGRGLYRAPGASEVHDPGDGSAVGLRPDSATSAELLEQFLMPTDKHADQLRLAADGKDRVRIKLEFARQKLLDFGIRNNPMLNYVKPRGMNRGFRIIDELPAEVHRLLVLEQKPMSFGGTDGGGDGLFSQPADPNEIADRHLDTVLQTPFDDGELQKRLNRTSTQATTLVEDLGVNTLYLTLGMLIWKDPEGKKDQLHAPLLLVPVTLEREGARSRFRLRWSGEDVGYNLTLAERLAQLGISLPRFEDPEDLDVRAYLVAVEQAIAPRIEEGWKVDLSAIVLGFFSFGKFLMYRDLDPANWTGALDPEEPRNVLARVIENRLNDGTITSRGETLDVGPTPAELSLTASRNVVDADGSQNAVVHGVEHGQTLVVQGPPGTGKSQTITNLLSDALGAGKRVLFVAEKLAALEVVQRRLETIGIGDACLQLRSNKMNKTSFIQQLADTVSLGAPEFDASDPTGVDDYERRLDEYVREMNSPIGESDRTPFEVFGALLAVGHRAHREQVQLAELALSGDHWTAADYATKLDAVRDLARVAGAIGSPSSHAWWGANLPELVGPEQRRLWTDLDALDEMLDALAASRETLAAATGSEPDGMSLDDLGRRADAFERWADAPVLDAFVLDSPAWSRFSQLHRLKDLLTELAAVHAEFGEVVATEAWADPTDSLRADLPALDDARIDSLRRDTGAVRGALEELRTAAQAAQQLAARTAVAFALEPSEQPTRADLRRTAAIAERIVDAPDLSVLDIRAEAWERRWRDVDAIDQTCSEIAALHTEYEDRVSPGGWGTDVGTTRGVVQRRHGSFLKFASGEWRTATKHVSEVLVGSPLDDIPSTLAALDAIERERSLQQELSQLTQVAADLVPGWRNYSSWTPEVAASARWLAGVHAAVASGELPATTLTALVSSERRSVQQDDVRRLVASLDTFDERVRSVQQAAPWWAEELRDITSAGVSVLADEWQRVEEVLRRVDDRFASAPPTSISDINRAFAAIDKRITLARQITDLADAESTLLRHPAGNDTEWIAHLPTLTWLLSWHDDREAGDLPSDAVDWLLRQRVERPQELVQGLHRTGLRVRELVMTIADQVELDERSQSRVADFTEVSVDDLAIRARAWSSQREDLHRLITLNRQIERVRVQGLDQVVALLGAGNHAGSLTPSFQRAWHEDLLKRALSERPAIGRFDSSLQTQTIREFRDRDKARLVWNRARIARAHFDGMPALNSAGQMADLRGQFGRKRGLKPIRTVIRQCGHVIQQIKPIFMMSPMSVATFLPADLLTFDLVVFDEASQVEPVEGFGALLRGRQAVVVGDKEQLPPTNFFGRGQDGDGEVDDEDVEAEELGRVTGTESILTLLELAGAPNAMLNWHYRSEHESLIHVSNGACYDNQLRIFPSPDRGRDTRGLVLHVDSSAVYERGGSRTNPSEAIAVARRVIEHAVATPQRSLGIVAFSVAQRDAIIDQIEQARRASSDPRVEEFFALHPSEKFFVKNLENVQGEERDSIFISIGYGRLPNGAVTSNFGPINKDGGKRRLNVLISRARQRCEVFSSFTGDELRASSESPDGIQMLRDFLLHAAAAEQQAVSDTLAAVARNDIAEVIGAAVEGAGWPVRYGVGTGSCTIDIAVCDRADASRYLLGIMLDGPDYDAASVARDRDRITDTVLRRLGWNLHRIWAPDWYQAPETSAAALGELIESIQDGTHDSEALDEQRSAEVTAIDRAAPRELPGGAVSHSEAGPYVEHEFSGDSSSFIWAYSDGIYNAPIPGLAAVVAEVAQTESPVHFEDLVRRIADGAGMKSLKSRAREHILMAVQHAMAQGLVVVTGDLKDHRCWLWAGDPSIVEPRSRSEFATSMRKFDRISPHEIMGGVRMFVANAVGITSEQAYEGVRSAFGFKRASTDMQQMITAVIEHMVDEGMLERRGGALFVTETSMA